MTEPQAEVRLVTLIIEYRPAGTKKLLNILEPKLAGRAG